MSNEELVSLIQAGEREKLPLLWGQVERFVAQQARHRVAATHGFGGVEFDDLYNSGYIAMVAAVESFDPAAGSTFVGWVSTYLKTAFAEAGGYRSRKQARDPLHRAGSLDAPAGEDENGATLGDLIADLEALQEFERVEARQYRAQLHNALNMAMGQLPACCRNVVRHRFYRGQTFSAISAETGIPLETLRQWEGEALKRLRNPRISRPLMEYLPGRGYGA